MPRWPRRRGRSSGRRSRPGRGGRSRRAGPTTRLRTPRGWPTTAVPMNPSGSDSARPVRFAPPRKVSGRAVGLDPGDRREVAGRAEQQPQHGEHEGERGDGRRADQVLADDRIVALEREDRPAGDPADDDADGDRPDRDGQEHPLVLRSVSGSVTPRSGMPIVAWTTRNATNAPTIPAASARKPPTRTSSGRSWKTPRLAQKPAIRPMTPATGAKKAAVGPAPPGHRQDRPDQVRQDAGQRARPRSRQGADEHGPDRVEVDRQTERDGDRADRDVDRDGDRHQRQDGGRQVARPTRDDREQDRADDQGDEIDELDRRDAAVVWPSAQIVSQLRSIGSSSSLPVPCQGEHAPPLA